MGYGEMATHATLTRTFAGSSPAIPVCFINYHKTFDRYQ